jgi:hypothetical protein
VLGALMRDPQFAENASSELQPVVSKSYPEADLEIMRLNKHSGLEYILRSKR